MVSLVILRCGNGQFLSVWPPQRHLNLALIAGESLIIVATPRSRLEWWHLSSLFDIYLRLLVVEAVASLASHLVLLDPIFDSRLYVLEVGWSLR